MLAGVPGFEPGRGGIKIRCLTAWLHPNGAMVLGGFESFCNSFATAKRRFYLAQALMKAKGPPQNADILSDHAAGALVLNGAREKAHKPQLGSYN